MTTITINECVYYVHPIYDLYAASKDGNVINIVRRVPCEWKSHCGYSMCTVSKYAKPGKKNYLVHRLVWECHNGIIPEGKVIEHINENKEDNRLCNLQILTQKQNCQKSAKYRDFSYVSQNRKNKKCVKAVNKNTNVVTFFNSLYSVNQHLSINTGIVKKVCEGWYGYKSGISKKDGHAYTFEYINQEDLPENHKKSANIRPKRVSDEEKKKKRMATIKKWQNIEYECPKCSKVIKNNNRSAHNKKCNSQKQ